MEKCFLGKVRKALFIKKGFSNIFLLGVILTSEFLLLNCSHRANVPGDTAKVQHQNEMIFIPAGEFIMGAPPEAPSFCEAPEKPAHNVYLDEFWIDKYEVTNSQYHECVKAGRCSQPHFDDGECVLLQGEKWQKGVLPGDFRGGTQPVVCVDWEQARNFCKWAGKRLPTEAQWEKSARGTDGRLYPWGNEWRNGVANFCDMSCKLRWRDETYNDGFEFTAEVGSFPFGASPYGVHDLAGNVWEWTADWYDECYYAISERANPLGAQSGEYRVIRGGSWHLDPPQLRATNRKSAAPTESFSYLGFRCAR